METEFEVKILDIDVEQIKNKLEEVGAKKHLERSMKRYVYDVVSTHKHTWIRLRDQGDKVTLTLKQIQHDGIDGTKETEIEVNNFEKTNLLLNKLGFLPKAYQENKRISYKLGNVEIEIDFWPKIPSYLEIEAKSTEEIEKTVKLLGFDMNQTTSIGVQKVYEKYGINIDDFKELKF
ncbi:adenylate cyclase [Candidatus Woesearchaeota archaeon B3_Woes]|nr:MAG: adenylate cyclase [Candidatus Woesearchaeota archaeon B3_Woes]